MFIVSLYVGIKVRADNIPTEFGYTGSVQWHDIPYDGTYKIEAYGAQGGDYGNNRGGMGGQTISTFSLKGGDKLAIYVGGQGNATSGGWGNVPGGAPGTEGSGGGGATEVYLVRDGAWDRLQVSGGGGGANRDFSGGSGGDCVYDTGGLSGSSGGSGGGYSYGVSGRLTQVDVPFLYYDPPKNPDGSYIYHEGHTKWQSDKRDERNWRIGVSRSGSWTDNTTEGYQEGYLDLYEYGQYTGGEHIKIFSGWFDVNGAKSLYYDSALDVADKYRDEYTYQDLRPDWQPLDIDNSFFMLVDQDNNIIEKITVRDVLNGHEGTSVGWFNNDIDEETGNRYGYVHEIYRVAKAVILPQGTTKVGLYSFMQYNSWVLEGQQGLNSGVYIDAFYGSNSGFPASGGSSFINSGYSASDTAYSNGNRSGDGLVKVTSLHTHKYTSEVTTQPTCTEKGVRTYTCTGTLFDPGCGHTYTEDIEALGHLSPDDYSYATDNGVANGLAYKNCQRCGIRLDSLWLNRIGVKFQKVDGTYTNEEYKVNGYYYSGNTISWSRDADDAFPYAGTSWVSGSQARVETLVVNRNKVSLDLNSWLDGEKRYSLGECATADVYINGVKVADDIADYCNTNLLYGSTYSIEQKIKEGYTYNGIHSGYDNLTGTLNGSKWVEPDFTTNYYNLTLLKGVGINSVSGGGRIKYDTTVVIDANVSTGYVWKQWSGTWVLPDKMYTFTMPAYDVTLEAIGSPITYQIRYDKGLTNN